MKLIGMIIGRFFGIIGEEIDVITHVGRDMFWETARKDGYGMAFFGILISAVVFVARLCFRLILCPFVVYLDYLTNK